MTQQLAQEGGPLGGAEIGAEIGVSEWLTIDQDMINGFGAITLDSDPLHDDPEWAAANSPYRSTIAFGFQTIGLLTHLMRSALGSSRSIAASAQGYPLNYGFDRLRLVAPVPVNSRIRGRFTLNDRSIDGKGRTVQRIGVLVEIENHDRPALIAEWLSVWVPGAKN